MVIVTALLLIVAIIDPRNNECDSATAHALTCALINIYYLKMASSSCSSSSTASSELTLMKKPKAVSIVWDYFGLRVDNEGRVLTEKESLPVCRVCLKEVPPKSGNTSNMLVHLREHHPDKYSEAHPKVAKKGIKAKGDGLVQPTLQQTYERATKYPPQSPTAVELNSAVTYFIAKDMQPVSIVEKPGFQHMVSKLNPRYQLPSRKHFSDYEVPKLYNHVRDVIVIPKLTKGSIVLCWNM